MKKKEPAKAGMGDVAAVDAAVRYYWNTDPAGLASALFANPAPSYVAVWRRRYNGGFNVFWANMDTETKLRFLRLAAEKYGSEAFRKLNQPDGGAEA